MPGKIVTGPKGWKQGPPIYSPEGTYYPTWVRDLASQPKPRPKKKKTRKHNS